MKIGLIGFGKTGRSVATIILENPDICLEWVVRKSTRLEHRSVPEFLGVESEEPGLIYSKDEYTAAELIRRLPVDAIIDFSSQSGLDWYGEAAADADVSLSTLQRAMRGDTLRGESLSRLRTWAGADA